MSEEIDQLSFASILAGVKKMRQDYEVNAPAPAPPAPAPPAPAPPQENTPTPQVGLEKRPIIEPNVTNNTNNFTSARQIHANIENNGAPVTAARPRPTTGSPQPTTNPRTNRRTTNASVHSYTQVQVAQLQKGNPLLESPQMKLTPWAYNGQILLDYYINATVRVVGGGGYRLATGSIAQVAGYMHKTRLDHGRGVVFRGSRQLCCCVETERNGPHEGRVEYPGREENRLQLQYRQHVDHGAGRQQNRRGELACKLQVIQKHCSPADAG